MRTASRATKRTKFGTEKHVYDAGPMRELRGFFEQMVAATLPAARSRYST